GPSSDPSPESGSDPQAPSAKSIAAVMAVVAEGLIVTVVRLVSDVPMSPLSRHPYPACLLAVPSVQRAPLTSALRATRTPLSSVRGRRRRTRAGGAGRGDRAPPWPRRVPCAAPRRERG